jgi:hypothetical protein
VHHTNERWWVRTTNHSASPVFCAEVVEISHEGGKSMVEPIPGAPAVLKELAAGQTKDRAIARGNDPASGIVVQRYIDAAGQRWHRVGTGQPERILGCPVHRPPSPRDRGNHVETEAVTKAAGPDGDPTDPRSR